MAPLAETYVDWASMWKILVISIVAGAGLVTIYSIGLLAFSASGYMNRDEPVPGRRNVLALLAGVCCVAVVVVGVVYGIHIILAKE